MSELLAKYRPTMGLGGNVYMSCDGFGVSYNASPGMGFSVFASDDGAPETALCVDDKFFILNGDFREEYAELAAQGLDACLRFFLSRPEIASSWSNSADEARALLEAA